MLACEARAWLEVDLKALDKNIESIRKSLHGNTKIMGIVKANAYGAGDIMVAKRMVEAGIDFFGVSSIDEAITLRTGGIQEEILILGYTPPMHFEQLLKYNIIQTIVSHNYALKLNAYSSSVDRTIRCHIKVDTGMQRIGIPCLNENYQIDKVKDVYHLSNLCVEGIFSHFSVSDDIEHEENIDYTNQQIHMFKRVLEDLRNAGIEVGIKHLQNSYGIINYPELSFDYVRPGIILLGITQRDDILSKHDLPLYPILTLKANVSLVKEIKAGTSVSYGRNYRSSASRKIATLSIGYADGYPRIVSNRDKKVLIHGKYVAIIGNICMDQMLIDVSDIDEVNEGDVAILFGSDGKNQLSIDELSREAQTINNETTCWITSRVPRIYKD